MKLYRIGKEDLSSVAGFITLGLMMGQMGPLLSAASVDLGVDAQRIGTTISVFYGISILGIVAGLLWIRRIGKEVFLFAASLLLVLAYAAGLSVQDPRSLLWVTLLTGLGLGMYQIGINSLVVDRTSSFPEGHQAGRISYLQFFFGVGAVMAPLLVDVSHHQLGNWRLSYLMVLGLGPFIMVVLTALDLRGNRRRAKLQFDEGVAPVAPLSFEPIQWRLPLLVILTVAAVYTALETSMFNWLSYYWDQRIGSEAWVTGARASAVFWFVFSISRASMGPVIARFGTWRSLLTFSILIGAILLCWAWVAPGQWGMLSIVVGIALLMGCMFPTILVLVSRLQPGDSSQIVGVLFILITASGTVAPIGIGQVSKRLDIAIFPWTLLGIAILLIAGLLYARHLRRKAQA